MSARFKLTSGVAERDILADALLWLASQGIAAWRQNSGTVYLPGRVFRGAPKGTPDIIGYLPNGTHGRLLAIETKTEAGRLTKEQYQWQQKALAAGVRVATCRSLGEVQDAVRAWLRAEEHAA